MLCKYPKVPKIYHLKKQNKSRYLQGLKLLTEIKEVFHCTGRRHLINNDEWLCVDRQWRLCSKIAKENTADQIHLSGTQNEWIIVWFPKTFTHFSSSSIGYAEDLICIQNNGHSGWCFSLRLYTARDPDKSRLFLLLQNVFDW